jgi:phosphoadenosine phosphosulfate reductase
MKAVQLYGRARGGQAAREAATVQLLQEAARAHAGHIVLATSLGAEDMVLTELIVRHQLPIAFATLETGALHVQTQSLLQQVQRHYDITIECFRPNAHAAIAFVREHGHNAMYRSVESRQACCALRKLEPLQRLLEGRSAWVTGLRHEQSAARAHVAAVTVDDQGRSKYSPLLDWTQGDVWHHIGEHGVPYNPLHDQLHPSIGCAPCTRAVAVGEDERAGRWWWEQAGAKECGLHPHSQTQHPSHDEPLTVNA